MKRFFAAILVMLGGCTSGQPEDKPATPKSGPSGLDEARAAAEAKERAGVATMLDAKAREAEAKEEAKAALAAEPSKEPTAVAAVAPAAAAAGPALEPFEGDGELYGYRTAAGKVVIPPKYALAMPFVDAVAAVAADAGWVFIDRTGKELASAFVFDNVADEFVDGRARIIDGEKHGFIASTGEIVVPPAWSFVEPFSGGFAAVCEGCTREEHGEHYMMTGGKWGYVDRTGKLAIPPRFEQAGPFVDGRATVKEGGRELVIGPDGAEPK